jgi:hypothetical protein
MILRPGPFRKIIQISLLLPGFLVPVISNLSAQPGKSKPVTRGERVKWFHEARFGMMITWGAYSQAGGWENPGTLGFSYAYSIHDTLMSPKKAVKNLIEMVKPHRLFVHVLDWNDQKVPIGNMDLIVGNWLDKVKKVYLLGDSKYWSAHPMEFREEFSVDGKRSEDHNRIHDNMFDLFPDRTIEVIRDVEVPVVGFKVLAAGAIPPNDGFRYAFENGADFICVGMFDFQIVENVNTAIEVLNGKLNRERNWYG